MELRVTTGTAKNKRLLAPQIPDFRAVQEVAKSSVFSIIGSRIENSVCLDLFAGSGNMGIESLSRGAAWCDFVDENPEACVTIKKNLENCGFLEKSAVHLRKAGKFLSTIEKKYDFIFIDPFYKDIAQIHLFKSITKNMHGDTLIFYFHSANQNLDSVLGASYLEVIDNRKFGISIFSVLKRKRGC